jgi:hypothetical protein
MMETQYVTPSLFLGKPPRLSRTAKVTTASEALDVIRAGGVAVLPVEAGAEAEQVLTSLGVSRAKVARRMKFARTASL